MAIQNDVLERGMIAARDAALASLDEDHVDDDVIYDRMLTALDDAGVDGDLETLKKWCKRWFTCVNDCQYEDISKLSPGGSYWPKYFALLQDVTGSNEEELGTINELRAEMLAGVVDWANGQNPKGHVTLRNLDGLVDYIESTYKIKKGWGATIVYILLKQLLDEGKLKRRGVEQYLINMIDLSIEARGGDPDEIFNGVMKQGCDLLKTSVRQR